MKSDHVFGFLVHVFPNQYATVTKLSITISGVLLFTPMQNDSIIRLIWKRFHYYTGKIWRPGQTAPWRNSPTTETRDWVQCLVIYASQSNFRASKEQEKHAGMQWMKGVRNVNSSCHALHSFVVCYGHLVWIICFRCCVLCLSFVLFSYHYLRWWWWWLARNTPMRRYCSECPEPTPKIHDVEWWHTAIMKQRKGKLYRATSLSRIGLC